MAIAKMSDSNSCHEGATAHPQEDHHHHQHEVGFKPTKEKGPPVSVAKEFVAADKIKTKAHQMGRGRKGG